MLRDAACPRTSAQFLSVISFPYVTDLRAIEEPSSPKKFFASAATSTLRVNLWPIIIL